MIESNELYKTSEIVSKAYRTKDKPKRLEIYTRRLHVAGEYRPSYFERICTRGDVSTTGMLLVTRYPQCLSRYVSRICIY